MRAMKIQINKIHKDKLLSITKMRGKARSVNPLYDQEQSFACEDAYTKLWIGLC